MRGKMEVRLRSLKSLTNDVHVNSISIKEFQTLSDKVT